MRSYSSIPKILNMVCTQITAHNRALTLMCLRAQKREMCSTENMGFNWWIFLVLTTLNSVLHREVLQVPTRPSRVSSQL